MSDGFGVVVASDGEVLGSGVVGSVCKVVGLVAGRLGIDWIAEFGLDGRGRGLGAGVLGLGAGEFGLGAEGLDGFGLVGGLGFFGVVFAGVVLGAEAVVESLGVVVLSSVLSKIDCRFALSVSTNSVSALKSFSCKPFLRTL